MSDELLARTLREMRVREIASQTGIDERVIKRARATGRVSPNHQAILLELAADHARRKLREVGLDLGCGRAPEGQMLAAYQDAWSRIALRLLAMVHAARFCDCGCARVVDGRRRYHSQACRKRGPQTGHPSYLARIVRKMLRIRTITAVSADTGLPKQTIRDARDGRAIEETERKTLERYIGDVACGQLSARGVEPPRQRGAAIRMWLGD